MSNCVIKQPCPRPKKKKISCKRKEKNKYHARGMKIVTISRKNLIIFFIENASRVQFWDQNWYNKWYAIKVYTQMEPRKKNIQPLPTHYSNQFLQEEHWLPLLWTFLYPFQLLFPFLSKSAFRSLSSFSFIITTFEGSMPTFTVAPALISSVIVWEYVASKLATQLFSIAKQISTYKGCLLNKANI